jgi:protein CpxP
MFQAFDRAGRTAIMAGIATVLMLLPPAAGPATARSDDAAPLQLAQAARQGGAKAAAPAPAGSEIDRQIADLKKQLKITPQQEPQFNAFAEVMRSNEQDLDKLMQQGSANRPNAVEDLKQAQQLAETQAAGLKRLVPAFQSLYDSLSDQQKKTADQVMGGGPGGGPGGPGGAPGGPPPAPRGGRG